MEKGLRCYMLFAGSTVDNYKRYIYLFIFINMNIQVSLRVPRLISWALKLTSM